MRNYFGELGFERSKGLGLKLCKTCFDLSLLSQELLPVSGDRRKALLDNLDVFWLKVLPILIDELDALVLSELSTQ
jgi:hypothetical protein